jgi:hypothetical protein
MKSNGEKLLKNFGRGGTMISVVEKHVNIVQPAKSGSDYNNCKANVSNFKRQLWTIVFHECTKVFGRGVLQEKRFYEKITQGSMQLPGPLLKECCAHYLLRLLDTKPFHSLKTC